MSPYGEARHQRLGRQQWGGHRGPRAVRGRAVQVEPIEPTLKAPGTKHLKLKYHKLI